MVQSVINRYIFGLLVFTLVFAILLYNLIGFDFTDEICALGLFALFFYTVLKSSDWAFNKAFLITLTVFAFYTCYSFRIGSNVPRAIVNDLVIQMKPYLAFFCVYHLKPCLNSVHKKLLRETALLCWFLFLLPIGVTSLAYPRIFIVMMEHISYFGIAVSLVSLCYLYGSSFTLRNKIIFLALLSLGLLCGRSKFYGFFTVAVFVVFFFSKPEYFKIKFKNILILLSMTGVVVLVAWRKIAYYFVNPVIGAGDMDPDLIVRLVLYYTMPQVLHDYFPFGSGFSSYATYSSGAWYSDLYVEYGLDNVWGMSKSYSGFISDAYYPCLAQFGVVGIGLFVWFWVYVIRKAFRLYRQGGPAGSIAVLFLIAGFLIIEETTASTLIAQGGFFVMMLMGLILSEMKQATKPIKVNDSPSYREEKIRGC
ncbi:MAG: O-antigen ligase domain-containing protein [Tannerella sp.]|jgi:hypothetical protein|nr:O-antigen ligase domain-containing protein [Tannerella sp.]